MIYGPDDLTVEQSTTPPDPSSICITTNEDQPDLSQAKPGNSEGTCTYSAYGTPTCEGTAATPLGYDGEYTSTDTSLIYMRARTYADPLAKLTGAPYNYAGDNPLNYKDPTGLSWQICLGGTISVGLFTLGGEACYVSTPGGSGLTGTGSVSLGPGAGANIHIGGGVSNVCTPNEYGGVFTQYGGSATDGVGGYGTVFSNVPVPGSGRAVTGATGGATYGLNAETGPGVSDTLVLPLTESKTPTPCGCVR